MKRYQRNAEAIAAREIAWRSLTPQQQLRSLDQRLGDERGAVKQRARIRARIAAVGGK